jgi:hypothetical protein
VIQGVANDTFINDPERHQRRQKLHPFNFCRMVGTLLEVNGRGYSLGGPCPQQRLATRPAE